MKPAARLAPAHPLAGCAGALFCAWLSLAGCGDRRTDEPAVLELETDTIRLPPGTRILDVGIEVRAEGSEFEPAAVSARQGDVVRFTAGDHRGHALVFDPARLDPEAAAFLESSGQLRGPPLLSAGTSWIVSLAGAPPGSYPFRCVTHDASGVLRVEARD